MTTRGKAFNNVCPLCLEEEGHMEDCVHNPNEGIQRWAVRLLSTMKAIGFGGDKPISGANSVDLLNNIRPAVRALSTKTLPRLLSDEELATTLAALRYWQNDLGHNEAHGEPLIDGEGHFAEHKPLTVEQIDGLCERLNLGEIAGPHPVGADVKSSDPYFMVLGALANLLNVLNVDKDGSYFVCQEAENIVEAARVAVKGGQ